MAASTSAGSVTDKNSALTYHAPASPQQLAARLGRDASTIIKLDSNENPYGSPPGVGEAILRVAANRYPESGSVSLKEALSTYTGCSTERIVLGNGSDELIDLLCHSLLKPGDEVLVSPPTFTIYARAALQNGAKVVDAWRSEADNFAYSADAMRKAVSESTKMIFLCSPDNPTGQEISENDLRSMLEIGVPVILDEAYVEFGSGGFLPLAQEYSNLVILRTFSKAFGLAGLRVGYGIFPAGLAERLERSKLPYNVNSAAQAAALSALQDLDWVQEHAGLVKAERTRMMKQLGEIEGVEPLPSAGNFLLVRCEGIAAQDVYSRLLDDGIMVRWFSQPPLDRYLRITVGTPGQNNDLLDSLGNIMRAGGER